MLKDTKISTIEFKFTSEADNVIMTWYGVSNTAYPTIELSPYFESLLPEIKGKNFIIDFRNLKYMNSATIHPIIHFLKLLNYNEIKTLIYYDKKVKWQALAFNALDVISRVLDKITIEGRIE